MKKRSFPVGLAAFFLGLIVASVAGFYSMPKLLMLEGKSPHGFEQTVELFEQKVKESGWSVLATTDMQAIVAKHGQDVLPIKIFELCSSKYSAVVLKLDDERIVSPLMPCRVSIYEKSDGKTYIARMNSGRMAKPFGGVINDVMKSAASETENAIAAVLKK